MFLTPNNVYNKEKLLLVTEKLLGLKLSQYLPIIDNLVKITYLFFKIEAMDEVKEVLREAELRIKKMFIKRGCNWYAKWQSHLMKIYKQAKMEEDSERILKDIVEFYSLCHETNKKETGIADYKKYVLYDHLVKRLVELKEFDKAKLFLKKKT